MAIDIKAKAEELVKKLTSDKALLAKFQKEPVATVESLLGVDLPDEQVEKVVALIKAKLGAEQFSGAAKALGSLFGKK